MTALSAIAVVASVLGLSGGQAKLDKGLIDGFRQSDRGRVYYTLTVQSRPVRIDVGTAEIVQADDFSALARPLEAFEFRAGFVVEVEVPSSRLAPEAYLKIADQRLQEHDYEAAAGYFEKMRELLPDDPLVERKLGETARLLAGEAWREQERGRLDYYRLAARGSLEEGDLRSADAFVRKILRVEPNDPAALEVRDRLRLFDQTGHMIRVPAGRYWIGADLAEASFYNQQPRFEAELEEFWIDRRAVSWSVLSNPSGANDADQPRPPAVGVTFDEAARHCRAQGKRLPSEFEWETASRRSGFIRAEGVSEWTASWYKPYPGNPRPEREYGEAFRVVKGYSQSGDFDPRLRFFMAPREKASDVGFRCALNGDGGR